ncbi:MAG TPA: hypothetical protein VIM30_16485 [Candidatus Limnocylindrales bacterium]|jgi:hypothetical protein
MSRRASAAERIYRTSLRLYPAGFRARYGHEMVQLFRGQLQDARARPTPGGIVAVWVRALGDLVITAISEHARKDRTVAHSLTVPPSTWTRALGVTGVLGGVVLLVAFLVDVGPGLNTIRVVLYNLGAIAIALALYSRQSALSPRLALLATAPVILANAWFLMMELLSVGRPQPPEGDYEFRLIADFAALAMWLADAALGLVIWRTGTAMRWIGLALALGSIFAFGGMSRLGLVSGDYAWFFLPAALTGIAINGLAWILLGLDTVTRRRPVSAPGTSGRRQ